LGIKIRKAIPLDFDSLALLVSQDEAWSRYGIGYREAQGLIQCAPDKFFLAEKEGEIVGFCALRLNGVGNIGAYIRMMIVAEPFRNYGIGKALLDYVWDLASDYCPNVFLICSAENVGAQDFYEREGFRRIGVLEDLVIPGHDEILYWKSAGPLRRAAY